jgi:hypothetical protein
MKPIPAKPRIIMAQVPGSGTGAITAPNDPKPTPLGLGPKPALLSTVCKTVLPVFVVDTMYAEKKSLGFSPGKAG